MKFQTAAEAYGFYRNMNIATMEARTEAIQTEIRNNAEADIQALSIELEGIESAIQEKRDEEKPAGYTTPEQGRQQPQHPGFTATNHADDAKGTKVYRSAFYKHLLGNDLTADERKVFAEVNAAERRADAFANLSNAAAVVPTKLLDSILVKARDMGGILSVARKFDIPANLRVPIATPGNAAQWHTEGAKVESEKVDPAFVEFNAFEIMKVISLSVAARTMTIDAFESYLSDELTASVMACLAQTMVDGDGDKKGLGILSGIEWTDDNQILATGSEWHDWKIYPRAIAMLHRGYSNGARFVMNNRTLYEDVISLHDDNNQPIYVHDLQNAHTGRLLGFEVTIDDYMEDHDIAFGNFSYMGYNLPQGIMLDVSRESSFRSGLIDYRAMAIADCKPIVEEAFVRLTLDE